VVRPREPHHFEGEGFGAEVPQVLEHNGQIDLPDGECLHPRDDPVEWCIDGLSWDRGMPMSSSVDT
jgi:hypothetical protein